MNVGPTNYSIIIVLLNQVQIVQCTEKSQYNHNILARGISRLTTVNHCV